MATVGLKGREWEGIGVEVGDEVVAFRKMTLSLSLSLVRSLSLLISNRPDRDEAAGFLFSLVGF